MTREEARKAAEVMLAYAEGKTIQYYDDMDFEKWKDCDSLAGPMFDWSAVQYRVKPEPKYRPYNSAKEFIDAQKEHGLYFMCDGHYYFPSFIDDGGITIFDYSSGRYHYRVLLADFTWQDGSPMGILED